MAIFIALSGTAVATNAVSGGGGKKQVVVVQKAQAGAAGKKGKKGKRGPQGPAGPQGPTGPSTGPAGGDLAGSYPNPNLRSPEAWHEVGASGEPAFSGTWVNSSPGISATTAFYRDPQGIVHLKGAPGSGTNLTSVFTLPVGYRPSRYLRFPALGLGTTTAGVVTIAPDGTVLPNVGGTLNGVTLDGVQFRACGAPGAEACP